MQGVYFNETERDTDILKILAACIYRNNHPLEKSRQAAQKD
jgi:hypothetical protein